MSYEQRVQIAEQLIAAIEKKTGTINEQDGFLLRQVRRYRDLIAAATSAYEAQIAVSNLSHCWVDSGDWDSQFAKDVERLLTPVRTES